jgi:lipopolysaccharide export LptBFGC system permease protein LptF
MLVSLFVGAVGPGLAFLALGLFFLWRSENTG